MVKHWYTGKQLYEVKKKYFAQKSRGITDLGTLDSVYQKSEVQNIKWS